MKALFAATFFAVCASPAYAGFFENELRVDWRYPDFDTVHKTWELVPGDGIEFDFGFHPDSTRTRIDIADDFLRVSKDCPDGGCIQAPAIFNGFWFQDLNNTMPAIIGFTVERSDGLEGLENSDIGFNENEIWFNWESVTGGPDWWFQINVEFIPAPATFALFGLAAFTTKRRRRM